MFTTKTQKTSQQTILWMEKYLSKNRLKGVLIEILLGLNEGNYTCLDRIKRILFDILAERHTQSKIEYLNQDLKDSIWETLVTADAKVGILEIIAGESGFENIHNFIGKNISRLMAKLIDDIEWSYWQNKNKKEHFSDSKLKWIYEKQRLEQYGCDYDIGKFVTYQTDALFVGEITALIRNTDAIRFLLDVESTRKMPEINRKNEATRKRIRRFFLMLERIPGQLFTYDSQRYKLLDVIIRKPWLYENNEELAREINGKASSVAVEKCRVMKKFSQFIKDRFRLKSYEFDGIYFTPLNPDVASP